MDAPRGPSPPMNKDELREPPQLAWVPRVLGSVLSPFSLIPGSQGYSPPA